MVFATLFWSATIECVRYTLKCHDSFCLVTKIYGIIKEFFWLGYTVFFIMFQWLLLILYNVGNLMMMMLFKPLLAYFGLLS